MGVINRIRLQGTQRMNSRCENGFIQSENWQLQIDFFLGFNAKNSEVEINKKTEVNQSWIAYVNHFWQSLNGIFGVSNTDCYLNVLPVENNPCRAETVKNE